MKIINFPLKRNNYIYHDDINTLIKKEELLSKNKKEIFDYIFFSKIISSYGVIALHLNKFWIFSLDKKKTWFIENIYETLFYYSVPFFVLCIGATLLNFKERYGLFEYNKKRFIKVFIPLICWTLILYLYKVYILQNIPRINMDFISIWNYFFSSKIYSIFNSLHIFLITYMFIPLLAFVEKSSQMRLYTYYFFLLLITQSAIPYFINIFGNKIIFLYKVNIGYLIYIFAGYIIHNHNFSLSLKIIIYILGISSFFVHLIGTKILAFKYLRIIRLHKGYLNLPCIIYSCALFLFIKEYYYLIYLIINKKYLKKIGSLTIGPFFMHQTVKETIERFNRFHNLVSFNLLFYTFIIFSICIIFSAILKRCPLERS